VESGSKQAVDWCTSALDGTGSVYGLSCTGYQGNTSPKTFTLGGSVQSNHFTPAVVNSTNFGVSYQGDVTQYSNYSEYFYITGPKVTIYYTN